MARLSPVLVCALAAVYVLVGDRTPWGEWLTIWPPVGWGILFFVRALVLWLEAYRRLALATALLAVLFVATTTELASLFRRPDGVRAARFAALRVGPPRRTGHAALRVVSWNVAGGAPLAELEALDPDVCLLQEIGGVSAVMKSSSYWSRFEWHPGFDPGTLTRHPGRVVETVKIGPWTQPQLIVVTLPNGQRVLLASVRLVLPSIVVSVASLGDFENVAEGHRERLDQFPRLASLLRTAAVRHHANAIILGGDFNTPGGMPSLEPLEPMLRDGWRAAGIGWGGTMTADMPVSRIDQCWVSDEVEVVATWVRTGKGSDHRMLVIDLLIGPPGPL